MMIRREQSEIYSDSFEKLHFARSVLPAKIIQLRRVSQDNHIRRLRMAYQKKELQELDGNSYLSSFPKRHLSCLQTTFTTPAGTKSAVNIMYNSEMKTNGSFIKLNHGKISPKCSENPIKEEKIKNEEAHSSSDVRLSLTPVFPKCESPASLFRKKLTPDNPNACVRSDDTVNKIQSLPDPQKNKQVKESTKQCKILESFNKTFISSSQKSNLGKERKLSDTPNYNKQDSKIGKPTPLKKCVSVSKIPISVSRISFKAENKNDILPSRVSDKTRKNNDSSGSKFRDQHKEKKKDFKELNEDLSKQNNELTPADKTPNIEKDLELTDDKKITLDKPPSDRDLQKLDNMHRVSPIKRSSISKWLSDILISDDNGKNYNCPHVTTCDESTIVAASVEKIPKSPILRAEIDESKSLGTLNKQYSDSSDESLESYYDPEDTEFDIMTQNSKVDTSGIWTTERFEDDDSTVTVPSDKDLDVESHRESIFRNLPDYPNTPYFLRYPRYKSTRTDNIYESCDLEAGDGLRRTKIRKNLKKSGSSTPRRKNSGRIKLNLKAKKQASKLKEFSA